VMHEIRKSISPCLTIIASDFIRTDRYYLSSISLIYLFFSLVDVGDHMDMAGDNIL
jgi:hypothetical protein